MILFHCVRLLQYALLCVFVMLFLAGDMKPQNAVAAFVLIPVHILLIWLKKRLWLRANKQKPVVHVAATLINHRQQFSGGRGAQRYEKSYLTFRLEQSGEELEFEVPREEFERIQIGANGPLEYQGALYLSFRKERV